MSSVYKSKPFSISKEFDKGSLEEKTVPSWVILDKRELTDKFPLVQKGMAIFVDQSNQQIFFFLLKRKIGFKSVNGNNKAWPCYFLSMIMKE